MRQRCGTRVILITPCLVDHPSVDCALPPDFFEGKWDLDILSPAGCRRLLYMSRLKYSIGMCLLGPEARRPLGANVHSVVSELENDNSRPVLDATAGSCRHPSQDHHLDRRSCAKLHRRCRISI
ncbi:uncharacterized protein EI90DRAFT_3061139 [Cantharellus anzutake]|uniref:uncharacterized protein n=1 Tax=Cantharellus anzutake TaxID=1750568 RepID=UPI001904B348|nr:uncharacterized protein EI90DRAFT_3061139 [Cantharellus anzutake]KAF8329980.1 hypothetical protein EI90DRAFT_3061139 [Cantharellus anzutake]